MKAHSKTRAMGAQSKSPTPDIVSAYIADQPREMLDQVAAMFLNHAEARPAFLEFFRSLSREQYNRLVRALYAIQPGQPLPDPLPDGKAGKTMLRIVHGDELDTLEETVDQYFALHSLIEREFVRLAEAESLKPAQDVAAGVVSLGSDVETRLRACLDRIGKKGGAR